MSRRAAERRARVLVTGATGYIGGRLAPRLIEAGHQVRCLTRSAGRLRDVPWASGAEIVEADVLDLDATREALDGIDTAYYLVHSLGSPHFEDVDRRAAHTFAEAARLAGVKRIVYLGGPEPHPTAGGEPPSAHLRSRDEVATLLAASGVPTVTLRAAVIIGSGSASFEMLRYLTERLPIMVTPRWVGTRIQPIAVRDVLHYLVEWASVPERVSRSFDIGGPDVLTYRQMMDRYARIAGLRPRVIVPVGVLTPWLSSQWVNLVTPVPGAIAKPLVASLIHEAVCREHDIARFVPDPPEGLKDFDEAVELALVKIRDADVETRWSNATWTGAPADPLPTDPDWSGGSVYVDHKTRRVHAPPDALWNVIIRIGGETGWYSSPLAWIMRGWLDRVIGGVGLRRGRRDPVEIYVGEALDFWRVEEIEHGRLLRLRAEMLLPGRAWLELRVDHDLLSPEHVCRYDQRAVFIPRGLPGHLYWQCISPFHHFIFGGMARNIARAAERAASPAEPTPPPVRALSSTRVRAEAAPSGP
ncbi:NAD(P)-dependent oxidoreductase [Catellatospora methionotrophica]|uniref:NAD(P)-dependent oxidoreductase n=1 Tax=Catellatospora methionotrophica TaxID=121620 RepID=A0A8J3L1I5_9ACTN|nr:SDR family oxidoreductase [Catellatospora methionotrophica]GIG12638.1 NAD(P)-dependent oxidoreductase [Catellatospora methionotrophica]